MEHYDVKICKNKSEIEKAFAIRRQVFTVEMQIDEKIERDDLDEICTHFLAFCDDNAVAAARLQNTDSLGKLGRMAVIEEYRHQGVGRDLIKYIIAHAKSIGIKRIELHSMASSRAFYYAMGFAEIDAPFFEAGIPHQKMFMDLSDD